jgi:hypothetical protein
VGFDRVAFVFHPLLEPLQRRILRVLERRDAVTSVSRAARVARRVRDDFALRELGATVTREEARLRPVYHAIGQFSCLAEIGPPS